MPQCRTLNAPCALARWVAHKQRLKDLRNGKEDT